MQSRIGKEDEQQRRSQFYYQPFVVDAVQHFSQSAIISSINNATSTPFKSGITTPPISTPTSYLSNASELSQNGDSMSIDSFTPTNVTNEAYPSSGSHRAFAGIEQL
jgi:hypothetical protein